MDDPNDPSLKLKNLDLALDEIVDWYSLGLQLDVPSSDLNKIHHDYTGTDERRQKMLDKWLEQQPWATWAKLVDALKRMNQHTVAEKISEIHKDLRQETEKLQAIQKDWAQLQEDLQHGRQERQLSQGILEEPSLEPDIQTHPKRHLSTLSQLISSLLLTLLSLVKSIVVSEELTEKLRHLESELKKCEEQKKRQEDETGVEKIRAGCK